MSQLTAEDGAIVRRYEYDDRNVVVADLGAGGEEVAVDVVDDTAIVVVEDGGRATEQELELPPGTATTYINNGVVTVEVEG